MASRDRQHRYANRRALSSPIRVARGRAAKGPEEEPLKAPVLGLAPGLPTSFEPSAAELREEALGVGAESVGQVERSIGGEVPLEEIGERQIGTRVVNDLGAEDDVEALRERAGREVELEGANALQAGEARALAHELERRG